MPNAKVAEPFASAERTIDWYLYLIEKYSQVKNPMNVSKVLIRNLEFLINTFDENNFSEEQCKRLKSLKMQLQMLKLRLV